MTPRKNNAGGPHCLKYGVTTNHIVSLEVVLPDGSVTRLGSDQGEAWGPDLVGLFVGSEGMFGIATEITVRLEQNPESVRTMLADFMTVRAASEAVSAIIATGIVPAALEMMDKACVAAVEASIYAAGYPTDAAAVLLVELDGQTDAVGAEAITVRDILLECGAREVRSASTAVDRARLWQGRKKAFGAMGRIAPDLAVQDAVVPRSALPDIMDRIEAIRRLAFHHVELIFGTPVAAGLFSSIDGVSDVEVDGSVIRMRVAGPIGAVLAAAAPHGIVDVVSREPNLEDVFLAQYGATDGR